MAPLACWHCHVFLSYVEFRTVMLLYDARVMLGTMFQGPGLAWGRSHNTLNRTPHLWTRKVTQGFTPLSRCRRYRVRDQELNGLQYAADANPINVNFTNMHLFRKLDVLQAAAQRYGGVSEARARVRPRLSEASTRSQAETRTPAL